MMRTLRQFTIPWALAQKFIYSDHKNHCLMDNFENKRTKGKHTALIIIGSFLFMILVYFTIMSVRAPGKKLDEIRAKFGLQATPENKIDERFYSDSAYMAMLKDCLLYT